MNDRLLEKHRKKLKKFYQELVVWIDKGMPEHKVFAKDETLCPTLQRWLENLPWWQVCYYDLATIFILQRDEFIKFSGNPSFPFGNYDNHLKEIYGGEVYQNTSRVDYIRKQAGMV